MSTKIARSSDAVTRAVIGAAIEVHRTVGPGLLEAVYQACLADELQSRGIRFRRELWLPLHYGETRIAEAYRVDFLVEGAVIVEIKAIAAILPIHRAQLATYLRLAGLHEGLLINFHQTTLVGGLERILEDRRLSGKLKPCGPASCDLRAHRPSV